MIMNNAGYVIRLSENAVMGMILNGIEAYSILHEKKEPFVETCGALFGYQLTMKDNRTLFQVETANIDTSAKRKSGGVTPNLDAMKLKTEMMARHWPHLEYLGDFHTHPYENCSEVKSTKPDPGDRRGDNKGYFISLGDKNYLKNQSQFYKDANCDYRIGLVITIAAIAADRGKEAKRIHKNCIEFNLKRHKMWITAYCACEKNKMLHYTGNKDPKVFLECQSILGDIKSFL